ncbi:MAG TPA: hypothetical protein VFA46_01765 [Actinomycetes bacterium]|nr:hypothetical protein [Actinomycetes bacterium]
MPGSFCDHASLTAAGQAGSQGCSGLLATTSIVAPVDAGKLSFYAATCYTWLGDRDHAREQAGQVIHQCLEVPGQVRWPIRLAETRVDLGLVAAREGEIDGAGELGRLALASERKSGSTLGRVAELDAVLMREHPDVGEVVDLHEQFEAARQA